MALTKVPSEMLTYDQGGTGSVERTVESKFQDTISVFDYMTSAQIADVKADTLLVDVSTAVQTAIDARVGEIHFPPGSYLLTSPIELRHGTIISGSGAYEHATANVSVLHGRHTGAAIILSQLTLGAAVRDFHITGDTSTTPKTGIAHGRSSSASSGQTEYTRLRIEGYFSVACIYLIASEGNVFDQVLATVDGGTALYVVYISQADVLSVNSFTSSSCIFGKFTNCEFKMRSTIANSFCLFMDLSGLTTDWVFENNYFVLGNGGMALFHNLVNNDGTRGPITFSNNGAEVLGGSTATYMFRFENNGIKTHNGMTFINNRLTAGGGTLPAGVDALSTNNKVLLKGMYWHDASNQDVAAMAVNIDCEGIQNSYIITQGTVDIAATLAVYDVGNTILYENRTETNRAIVSIPKAFTSADATPSVSGGRLFLTVGTTAITDFDEGVTGQEIVIMAESSITITDGTNIFLNGSGNFAMVSTDSLTLIQKADGKWYETARSDNT